MSDELLLRQRLRAALDARDRAMPPPAFAATWRAAEQAAAARRAAQGGGWFEPAVACAAIGAIALAAAWQFSGPRGVDAPWTAAADLQLARALAPSRQWPRATDGLLQAYDYTPAPIDVPHIKNPFEESFP